MDTEEEMCGICGFTGYRQDQKTVIERMMKAIEHRGPDSAQYLPHVRSSDDDFVGGEDARQPGRAFREYSLR